MSAPALVWLAIGAATTFLVGILAVALVRESILVGRTVGRLARELEAVGPAGGPATHRR